MYELVVLDHAFSQIVAFDDFESLLWVRKYYEAGNFELHCSADYLKELKRGKYLYCCDLPELGVIHGVQYESAGCKVVVSGLFAPCLLNDRIITEAQVDEKTPEMWVRQWLLKYAINPADAGRKIPGLALGEPIGTGTSVAVDDVRGKPLLETACALLKTEELGLALGYNPTSNTLTAQVWQGVDRTEEQMQNSLAVFSDEDETANTQTYLWDAAGQRNFAYVTNGDGATEVVVTVDKTQGAYRRETWVSVNMAREAQESAAAYAQRLHRQGVLELAKCIVEESVELGLPTSDALIYGRDYDLGDKVTYRDAKLGLSFSARVEGITITIESGYMTVVPSLGNDKYL